MKIVTFPKKNGETPKLVVDFLRERTLRKKTWKIVEDFIGKKSYNNNGKPWKSSRILRVKPKTFRIYGDFAFFNLLHFSFFHLLFSFFFIFFFFHFSVVRADAKTRKKSSNSS